MRVLEIVFYEPPLIQGCYQTVLIFSHPENTTALLISPEPDSCYLVSMRLMCSLASIPSFGRTLDTNHSSAVQSHVLEFKHAHRQLVQYSETTWHMRDRCYHDLYSAAVTSLIVFANLSQADVFWLTHDPDFELTNWSGRWPLYTNLLLFRQQLCAAALLDRCQSLTRGQAHVLAEDLAVRRALRYNLIHGDDELQAFVQHTSSRRL